MLNNNNPTKNHLVTLIALLIAVSSWSAAFASEKPALSEIVFYVTWYGVGKAALEGLEGVKKVESGFKGFREINTVRFDPSLISPDKLINALKRAGTFEGVAQKD